MFRLRSRYSNLTVLESQCCYVTTRNVTDFKPSGTTVIGQMSAVHQSEKHFKNAKQFNPQRFIDDPASAEKVELYPKTV